MKKKFVLIFFVLFNIIICLIFIMKGEKYIYLTVDNFLHKFLKEYTTP